MTSKSFLNILYPFEENNLLSDWQLSKANFLNVGSFTGLAPSRAKAVDAAAARRFSALPNVVFHVCLPRLQLPLGRAVDWHSDAAEARDRLALQHRNVQSAPGSCIPSCGKSRTPDTTRPCSPRP